MELKHGYKQADIDVIPEEWEMRSLDEDIRLVSGHHILAQYCNTEGYGIPYITGPADFPHGKITNTKFTDRPSTICEPFDILVTVKGSGSGTLVMADSAYCISRQLMAIRVVSWDRVFLFYSLLQNASQIKSASTGLIPGLSRADILEQKIPIPPVSEQRNIAAALSNVDALLEELERLIAKKRDLKQAAMQRLITGKTRLPGFSGEWNLVTAGQIGRFRGGSGFPLAYQGENNGTYPFFKVSDMNNEHNDTFMTTANNRISDAMQKQLGAIVFPPGTIVFAKVGAAIFLERKRILTEPSCLDNNMAGYTLESNRADIRFVHTFFLTVHFGSLVSTTALPSLNAKQLRAIELRLPPLDEQRAIAEALKDMDAEVDALEQRLKKTRNLKQAMMQELLTGKTRLVAQEVVHA